MREGGAPVPGRVLQPGPAVPPAGLAGRPRRRLRTFDAPRLLALAVGRGPGAGHLVRRPGAAPVAGGGRRWPPGWWPPAAASCGSPAPSRRTGRAWPWPPPPWPPPSGTAVPRPWPGRSRSALLIGAALSVKSLLLGPAVPVGLALLPAPRPAGPAPDAASGAAGRLAPVGLTSGRPWPPPASSAWWSPSPGASATCGTRPSSTTSTSPAPAPRSPTSARSPRPSATATSPSSSPLSAPSVVGRAGLAAPAIQGGRARADCPHRLGVIRSGSAWSPPGWGPRSSSSPLEHPLWRNHVAHLVPPAALLVGVAFERLSGPPACAAPEPAAGVALVGAGALAVPYHVVHMAEVLWPAPPGKALAAARADLRALPAGAWVISDDPGVVWRAGRRTPDDLVDASILRIESGRLTAAVAGRGGRRPEGLRRAGLVPPLRRSGPPAGPPAAGPDTRRAPVTAV